MEKCSNDNKNQRIAIIFDGSLDDRKGLVNAVINRAKSLISKAVDMKIDIYNFQTYDNWFIRKLRGSKKNERYNFKNIDGINIKTFWIPFSLTDYLLEIKFKKKSIFTQRSYLSKCNIFKEYDLISAHSTNCGILALKINKEYGIPYTVTWHGSDIHSAPFINKYKKEETIDVANNASCNFFVSQALRKISDSFISRRNRKEILYNGVGTDFNQFDNITKEKLKTKYNSEHKKIVCFAGNVIDIKNPLLLPPIFKAVNMKYNKPVIFWIIGDGKLKKELEKQLCDNSLEYVCWGNIPVKKMPEMLNCVDVLVLPSKNEGLPLITVEALACGANVVGSNVGGMSEAIGKDFVFDLDDKFVKNISTKITEILNNPTEQKLKECFDWDKSSEKEYIIYKELI